MNVVQKDENEGWLRGKKVLLVVKNPPVNAGDIRDVGSIPGLEKPLEEGIATYSIILAWRILWTEDPGGLQSLGSQESGTTEAIQQV